MSSEAVGRLSLVLGWVGRGRLDPAYKIKYSVASYSVIVTPSVPV